MKAWIFKKKFPLLRLRFMGSCLTLGILPADRSVKGTLVISTNTLGKLKPALRSRLHRLELDRYSELELKEKRFG